MVSLDAHSLPLEDFSLNTLPEQNTSSSLSRVYGLPDRVRTQDCFLININIYLTHSLTSCNHLSSQDGSGFGTHAYAYAYGTMGVKRDTPWMGC